MSVSFYPASIEGVIGTRANVRPLLRCACDTIETLASELGGIRCGACAVTLNVNNRNACDLLSYLGIEPGVAQPWGHIDARALAMLCEKRLAMSDVEAAIPMIATPRYVEGGRPADYLRKKCAELLVIARSARGWAVAWS